MQAQDLFHGAHEVEGVVGGGDQRIPDVGAGHKRDAAVGIDVVAAILRVVFDDKDESVAFVERAVRDLLHQQADRIVVIGLIPIRSIDQVNRGPEVSSVVVHEADQAQIGKSTRGVIGIEVPLPLFVTVVVGKRGVETAEVGIGKGREGYVGGGGHDEVAGEGVVGQGNGAARDVIAGRVHEKTIGANGETGAQRVVPQVSGIDFIVRSIGRSRVGLAGQQILAAGSVGRKGSAREKRIGGLAFGQGGEGNVDVAVHALAVKAEAALRVVNRILVLDHVGGASGSAPRPAVIADFGGIAEVVQGNELQRQVMLIGRDGLSKQSQIGIAIAAPQVAQNLVVGPVFLEDVDHVLDALMHGRHDRTGGGDVGEAIVRGHSAGERGQLRHGARDAEALQAGFG